jgi:EAL domain-containing protein (putative c-di-GMP-specific phosphodiesterase class I)
MSLVRSALLAEAPVQLAQVSTTTQAIPRTVQELWNRLPPEAIEHARRGLIESGKLSAADKARMANASSGSLLDFSVGKLGPAAVLQVVVLAARIYLDHQAYQNFLETLPREMKRHHLESNTQAWVEAAKKLPPATGSSAPPPVGLEGVPMLNGGTYRSPATSPRGESSPTPRTREQITAAVIAKTPGLTLPQRTAFGTVLNQRMAALGINDEAGAAAYFRRLQNSPKTWAAISSEANHLLGTQAPPSAAAKPPSRAELIQQAIASTPGLPQGERAALFQAISEAMQRAGIGANDGAEAARWLRNLPSSTLVLNAINSRKDQLLSAQNASPSPQPSKAPDTPRPRAQAPDEAMREALQHYLEQLSKNRRIALTPEGERMAERDARDAARRHVENHPDLTPEQRQLAMLALEAEFARRDRGLPKSSNTSAATDNLTVSRPVERTPGQDGVSSTVAAGEDGQETIKKNRQFDQMLSLMDVHVQPQYDVSSAGQPRLVGVEVLLNFRPAEDGTRYFPDTALKLAEEVGRMPELTGKVMKDSFDLAAKYPDIPKISFNVPPDGLTPAFLAEFKTNMARLPDAAKRVGVEVTEEGVIKPEHWEVLKELHGMGAKLSLDDFGTQVDEAKQSHFERLLKGKEAYESQYGTQGNLFDTVKLDGPFVDEKSNVFLLLTARLLKGLNVNHVLAERPENAGDLQYLREAANITLVQGFFTGRKMSPEQLMNPAPPPTEKPPAP